MKRLKTLILAIAIIAIPSTSALAQGRMGVRVGMAVNKLILDESITDADNTVGFLGGLTAEYMFPVLNVGVDASLLYRYNGSTLSIDELTEKFNDDGSSYLELPINLKWKLALPAIEKIVAPMVFTGPSFSVRLNKQIIEEAWETKTFTTSWNVGIGLQLLSKIQFTASYCIALSDAINITDPKIPDFNLKDNYWTINLAYLF